MCFLKIGIVEKSGCTVNKVYILRLTLQRVAGSKLAKAIRRKKRSKLVTVLLLPVLIIVFMVGWSLAYIGLSRQGKANQPQKPTNKTPTEKEELEIGFHLQSRRTNTNKTKTIAFPVIRQKLSPNPILIFPIQIFSVIIQAPKKNSIQSRKNTNTYFSQNFTNPIAKCLNNMFPPFR